MAAAACRGGDGDGAPADVFVDAAAVPEGDGSAARPFPSLQDALARAGAGTVVHVAAGAYQGPFTTERGGERDAPLRIIGDDATLVAGPRDHTITIRHDHVEMSGFTVAGGDQLLVIERASGARIVGNTFRDAGGECVRLKHADDNVVSGNVVEACGRVGFDLDADRKNGEGIYVGTAADQRGDDGVDRSSGNRVADNTVRTPAECIDVKEGATGNVVEGNDCSGSRDPVGGAISVRGNGNTVRANVIHDVAGAGVRLGGADDDDGIDNVVVDNRISDVGGVAVKVERTPQERVCDNRVDGTGEGESNTREVDPTAPC
jgi:hypothetical protein